MQKRQKIILGFVSVVALGIALNWIINRGKESTDDATIEAHAIPISSKVPGYVVALNVRDNQHVKKGYVLVEIDPRDYALKLDAAKAMLTFAQATAQNAATNAKRQRAIGQAAGTQKDIDNAVAAEATGKATMDNAQDQVALAEKDLADTKIIAPVDGVVTMRTAELGEYASIGGQLFTLVGDERWVIADFKEVQITDMVPGQRVKIDVDAYPDLKIEGRVDSIQSGTGARFSAFPAENATGNFVKIVQRVPVKITFDTQLPANVVLGPGLSVRPTVYVGDKPAS